MKLPGTDVRDEELEEIRLLEAEGVISADVEEKVSLFLRKVKAGKGFLETTLQDKTKFRQRIAEALRSTNDNFAATMSRLYQEILAAIPTVKEDMAEIIRLFQTADRVVGLIDDVESQQSRRIPSLNVKGRQITRTIEGLEEAEKRQIRAKHKSLKLVTLMLVQARGHANAALSSLNTAFSNYRRAKTLSATRGTRRIAANFIVQVERYLQMAKDPLETAGKELKAAKSTLHGFKNYLRIPERESQKALTYEQLIGKLVGELGI